jgi:hypothetical protein
MHSLLGGDGNDRAAIFCFAVSCWTCIEFVYQLLFCFAHFVAVGQDANVVGLHSDNTIMQQAHLARHRA